MADNIIKFDGGKSDEGSIDQLVESASVWAKSIFDKKIAGEDLPNGDDFSYALEVLRIVNRHINIDVQQYPTMGMGMDDMDYDEDAFMDDFKTMLKLKLAQKGLESE